MRPGRAGRGPGRRSRGRSSRSASRSGVLTSVHAFAVDPRRGIFILFLFAAFIGGALALFAWRTARIGLGGSFAPVSRESFLLANNVLLAAAAGTVFLGTLYPLALD